ncbi:SAG family member [Eimeria mitis]|uniref:SAG family member n=1 Tax=Eimeria mitis TaxID=44415 RepID=U6K311_9EIME|nr:SAG family member [Eimeria mitis]CDJ32069.1 SAG family member [Eimeria mitis]
MPVLKFLSVAAAAIFFSHINSAYGADMSPGGTIETPEHQGDSNDNENEPGSGPGDVETDTATNKAVRAECWEQMNAARNRVGFAELTHEKRFKITQDDWPRSVSTLEDYLSTVCKGIKTNTTPDDLAAIEGTVAKEQWNKITAALSSSSAASAAPAALALAAAAFAAVFL